MVGLSGITFYGALTTEAGSSQLEKADPQERVVERRRSAQRGGVRLQRLVSHGAQENERIFTTRWECLVPVIEVCQSQ